MFSIFRTAFSKFKQTSTEGERLFREGYAQAQANQHDKAIELFTQSIEISDIYPTPFIGRGASYAYQERYLEAWDDYSRALQMELEDPSANAKENLSSLRQNMRVIEPLMVLNKQNGDGVRQLLVSDGLDYFTKRWVEQIREKLSNKPNLIRHFVLEEMGELYQLGGKHKEVALNSGFKSSEYLNLKESTATNEAFLVMKNILCCFSRDPDKVLIIRAEILKKLSNEFQDVYEEDVSILDLFKKVMDTPEFKKQKELFDLMSEMNSKDGCTTDEMPNGIGEFGLEPTNPIPTNTVHGSILYLGGLRTLDGKKVNNKRMGSLKAKNIQKPIDQYLITDESGEQLAVIYISPYQAVNSKKAPQGLKQVSPLL